MTYVFFYTALLLAGLISAYRTRVRRVFATGAIILLFVLVAFRFEVGCDWFGYMLNFESQRYDTLENALLKKDPAFWIASHVLHRLGYEYPYINVLFAIPFFWGLGHMARRQPAPLGFLILSFPVLIINMPMSALRQSAAIGFICVAFVAFQERKLARFIISVLPAGFFHLSALAFLAMAPFVKYKLSRRSIAASAVLVLPGAFFVFSDLFAIYAERYVDTGVDAAGAIYRSGMLAATALLFFFLLSQPFRAKFPWEYQLVQIGAWIMLATFPVVFVSTVIADRFGYYVTPIQLMILARIPYLVKGRLAVLLSVSPYAALGVVLLVWTSFSQHFQKCYVPYRTWLSWTY